MSPSLRQENMFETLDAMDSVTLSNAPHIHKPHNEEERESLSICSVIVTQDASCCIILGRKKENKVLGNKFLVF